MRRPIDCGTAGQMHNTSDIISRYYASDSDQLKSVINAQYTLRVCGDDEVPSDACDPASDVVKDNATAFCIVFIAQILAICFGKLVMHFKLRQLVENSNHSRRMANMDPKLTKRAKRYLEHEQAAAKRQKKKEPEQKMLAAKARFKRAVTVVRFTGRLADDVSMNEKLGNALVVEIAGDVAKHWVKHRFFFTMMSLAALQVTFLVAALQVGAQSA